MLLSSLHLFYRSISEQVICKQILNSFCYLSQFLFLSTPNIIYLNFSIGLWSMFWKIIENETSERQWKWNDRFCSWQHCFKSNQFKQKQSKPRFTCINSAKILFKLGSNYAAFLPERLITDKKPLCSFVIWYINEI